MSSDERILVEQIAYYRARAAEYDEWFNREGRYDRGPLQRARWLAEIQMIEAALASMAPLGDVLELACGTGLWTERLASLARSVRAIDASPEAVAINRARVAAGHLEYEVADIFTMPAPAAADVVFFAFWLSHVPSTLFEPFWRLVRASLRKGGRVFFVDSLLEPSSTAVDHDAPDNSCIVRRKLNDGREFTIVKKFYEPTRLERMLVSLDWHARVRSTGAYFLYGTAEPAE